MTKLDKLIKKIFECRNISYSQAETLLLSLGFQLDVTGSHHIFRKKGCLKHVSLKRTGQLLTYQLKDIQEILIDHGYSK
jgi:hypothetical protein